MELLQQLNAQHQRALSRVHLSRSSHIERRLTRYVELNAKYARDRRSDPAHVDDSQVSAARDAGAHDEETRIHFRPVGKVAVHACGWQRHRDRAGPLVAELITRFELDHPRSPGPAAELARLRAVDDARDAVAA